MIGIDEAGRGAWAGSMVVVAVRALDLQKTYDLDDSKKLTALKRQQLAERLIQDPSVDYAVQFVSAGLIDKKGLTHAQIKGMTDAVVQLSPEVDEPIILDGRVNYLAQIYSHAQAIVRADSQIPTVMAASIIAKYSRDCYMLDLDARYPRYGFKYHKGYGTKLHTLNLIKYKPLKNVHRFSYKPVIKALQNSTFKPPIGA